MEFELPTTRREAVANHLREEILSGKLEPGRPIRDSEIAARLNVSITPVREAITELVAEGLIDAAANKRRSVSVLTQRQAMELMDALGIVTVAALERARTLSTAQLEQLSTAVDLFTREVSQYRFEASRTRLIDIIRVLLEAADNAELEAMAERVMLRSLRRISLYPSGHLVPLWVDAFQDMLSCLRRGENAQAQARLREFFARLVQRMNEDRPADAVLLPGAPNTVEPAGT
ncbi:GntR family transcriptional regulator [Arthrobacter sp. NPDC055585]